MYTCLFVWWLSLKASNRTIKWDQEQTNGAVAPMMGFVISAPKHCIL